MVSAKKPGNKEKDSHMAEKVNARKTEDLVTYLLRITPKLREQLRIEAIKAGKNMSAYICDILETHQPK
jgi:predicted HicB family RNase H-like nuclease